MLKHLASAVPPAKKQAGDDSRHTDILCQHMPCPTGIRDTHHHAQPKPIPLETGRRSKSGKKKKNRRSSPPNSAQPVFAFVVKDKMARMVNKHQGERKKLDCVPAVEWTR